MQRQYSLPNCKIILEGLSNAPSGVGTMDILMKAECYFTGNNQVLSGGRVFWESLVKAVNAYGQECLSGLRHPVKIEEGVDFIHLEKNPAKQTHRLCWQPVVEEGSNQNQEKIELELNTVQLFDLVEAVDQFFADTTTLPEITQTLQPVSKRYQTVEEPVIQRATPPILGLVGVALASFAFFLMPIPEVRKVEPESQNNTIETVPETSETPLPQPNETIPPENGE